MPDTITVPAGAARWKLNLIDLQKILVHAAMVAAGAVATWGLAHLGDIHLGQWTPLVVAGLTTFFNIVRKWASDNSQPTGG